MVMFLVGDIDIVEKMCIKIFVVGSKKIVGFSKKNGKLR